MTPLLVLDAAEFLIGARATVRAQVVLTLALNVLLVGGHYPVEGQLRLAKFNSSHQHDLVFADRVRIANVHAALLAELDVCDTHVADLI
ncbi:hypothetical protein Tdes44962_MAKER01320 [Teratosphaeria destructans]|uniref:Uncharacterized protein n=1 Tax=Teratosphaeria destructans TaxID=418781 RepID=A0A9W7T0N4_9PEZI|nr:hypothetical protein Tdes44962_MAKER01320 [Teratosphaeria destructans]